jgi:hypothetical protein
VGHNKKRKKTETKKKERIELDFVIFWKCYPRKVGKIEARKAFHNAFNRATKKSPLDPPDHKPLIEPEVLPKILRSLNAWIQQEWDGKDPKYIPYAATWLNKDRWQDELTPYKCSKCQDTGRVTSVDGIRGFCYDCEARQQT